MIPALILQAEADSDDDRARRARILILVIVTGGSIGVFSGFLHLWNGSPIRAMVSIFAFAPLAIAIGVLHRTERIHPAACFLCAAFTALVLISPFTAADSLPLFNALVAVPLAATAIGGTRFGLIWTAITTGILCISAAWYPFAEAERTVAWNIVLISCGGGIAFAFADDARERALALARSARRRADENLQGRLEVERTLVEMHAVIGAAFRGAPSAMVLSVAATGEVLDVNDRFVHTLGIERDEMIGRTLSDIGIWPGAGAERADPGDGSVGLQDVEHLVYSSEGREIWFLTAIREIEIDGRRCRISQGVDITERKRMDAILDQRREELEDRFAERGRQLEDSQAQLSAHERLAAVGTLAAGIAHQINNPIGGIVAAAEFALGEDDGSEGNRERRRALEVALDEAQRCGRIVKSVLKFARDEPTPKWVENLSSTVRRAGELARSYVEERGGVLEINLSPDALPVMMSPIDVEQVVLNLVRNAAEAAHGAARVVVTTRAVGTRAEMTVSDNGKGIDDRARSQIFDPFYTTRLEDGGSGLGLSVVHGVVADHGGTVEIDSAGEGAGGGEGGTCFRISFPLARPDATDAKNPTNERAIRA